MRRDFTAYICDIFKAVKRIHEYTSGLDRETFGATPVIQDAVIRRFEIIGEAIVQCRRHHPAEVIKLGDVQEVIDFRNHLIHRYHKVASEIVWDIVQEDLPALLATVESLLQGTKCL